MTAPVLPRVAAIIAREIGVAAEAIHDDTTFAALGMDSLDLIELGMSLEDEFGVSLPDGVEHDWQTVGDATGWLEAAIR